MSTKKQLQKLLDRKRSVLAAFTTDEVRDNPAILESVAILLENLDNTIKQLA